MLLTRGLTSDFDSVCALYARVTSAMHEKGIAQWNWGTYPNADQIHKSIDAGTLYVVREGNTVVAAVTLDSTFEPAYDAVNWLFGGKPGTFHRLCIAPEKQRQGLGRGMMGEMLAILRSQGCTALALRHAGKQQCRSHPLPENRDAHRGAYPLCFPA